MATASHPSNSWLNSAYLAKLKMKEASEYDPLSLCNVARAKEIYLSCHCRRGVEDMMRKCKPTATPCFAARLTEAVTEPGLTRRK